jgi:gamma-tubulin complex component 2
LIGTNKNMDNHNQYTNGSTNDITRAAQARRRQRVVMNQPQTSPTTLLSSQALLQPVQSQLHDGKKSSHTPNTTPATNTTTTTTLMNQSIEVGTNATTLFASLQQSRTSSTKRRQPQPPLSNTSTTTSIISHSSLATTFSSQQQQPQANVAVTTTPIENVSTEETTPTSYFRSMMLSSKVPPSINDQLPHQQEKKVGSHPNPRRTTAASNTTANATAATSTQRNHQEAYESKNPLHHPPKNDTMTTTATTTLTPLSVAVQLYDIDTVGNNNTKRKSSSCIHHNSTNVTSGKHVTNLSYIRIRSMAYPTQTVAVQPLVPPETKKNEEDQQHDSVDYAARQPQSPIHGDNRNGCSIAKDDDHYTATLTGTFLKDTIEVLQIRSILQHAVDLRRTNHDEEDDSEVLHYGDTVTLRWTSSTRNNVTPESFVLSCCSTVPEPTNDHSTVPTRLHFLPLLQRSSSNSGGNNNATISNKSQQWKILSPSLPPVKVGRTALEEDAMQRASQQQQRQQHPPLNSTTNGSGQQRQSPQRIIPDIPIRYDDPIVLRNCATGGILSCTSSQQATRNIDDVERKTNIGDVYVITDATFQSQIDVTDSSEHMMDDENEIHAIPRVVVDRNRTSLMSQLQHSGTLIPSLQEQFAFVHSSVPIVPLWMTSTMMHPNHHSVISQSTQRQPRSMTESYMDMSYLFYPDRYETMQEVAAIVMTDVGTNQTPSHSMQTTDCNTALLLELFNTVAGQEQILLYELIHACLGLEGQFIRAISNTTSDNLTSPTSSQLSGRMEKLHFQLYDHVHCRWDVIVRRLIEDMLLLPTLFARIQYFVHDHTPGYEYGHVMQAYCDRLGQLVHVYIGTVVSWYQQYIGGQLTLQKFQIQLQTSMKSLSILYQICEVVQFKKGGALINTIREWQQITRDGDIELEKLAQTLLDAAVVPYMTRLLDWLEMGILTNDPQQEFMITMNPDPDTTWENRYTISQQNIIRDFFATDRLVEQTLAAGRYWNAVRSGTVVSRANRAVGRTSEVSNVSSLLYLSNVASTSAYIQTKHREASTSLLRLLKDDCDLLSELRMMKRYFLLEDGDFFVSFLDFAEEELLKDVAKLSRARMQHWMDSCHQMLDQNDDDNDWPTRGNTLSGGLQCRIASEGLSDYLDKLHAPSGGIDTKEAWTPMRHTYGGTLTSTKSGLTGLDTFYLDLATIPFPISTVLSSNAMGCYHLLFRHLFFAKYVERRMISIWKDHQMMKELKSLRGPMGATFLLRQRMLHLLQNLIYYMIFEVIEPNWLILEKSIHTPISNAEQTVDDILQHHGHFLQRTLEACLLTNRDAVRSLTKLLKTCLLFSEQMKRFTKATKLEDERNAVATEKRREVHSDFYSRYTKRPSSKFSAKHLQEHFRRSRSERSDRVHRQAARIEREVSGEPFCRMTIRFEEVFTKNLRDFMIQINSSEDVFHSHKVNLCIRLDYNGYITKSLGLGLKR